MANTFLTPSVIAREALRVLSNNLVLANLVHTDYSSEFAAKVGDTVTIRKPATFHVDEFSSEIAVQDVTEGSTTVTLDKHLDVSVSVTSKQMALSLKDFSEQVVSPIMSAFAQDIDSRIAARYVDVPYYVAGTSTAAVADIANIGKVMSVNKVPLIGRNHVMGPTTEAEYVVLDAFLHAEKRGDTQAIREASMGRVLGLDHYMDQNVKTHTKGTLSAGAGKVYVKGETAAAATQCVMDSTSLTGTLCVGDVFTVAGNPYVVTEAATASGNEITVKFYPAVPAAKFADDAEVTLVDTAKENNLAFHRNAFALVTRPLVKPMGAANSEVINYGGLSIRVVYGYNQTTKTDTISFDLLMGTKTLTPELACRFLN